MPGDGAVGAFEEFDFARFESLLNQDFVPMSVTSRDPARFRCRTRRAATPTLTVSDIAATTHEASHTWQHVRESRRSYLKVNVMLTGTGVVTQDDRRATLNPGDFAVYETSRPFSVAFEDEARSLVLMMPADAIDVLPRDVQQLTGVRIPGSRGTGTLVVPFLMQLTNNLGLLHTAVGARMSHDISRLIGTAMIAHLLDRTPTPAGKTATFHRILTYIESHLADADLDPSSLAAAHFLSMRRLHALFHDHGVSVASLIRTKRLDAACRELVDPGLADLTAAAIGARWGFADPASFSRAIKGHTGLTPMAFRRERQAPAGSLTAS
ncbi:AraC-like ligand-binding domain-containing protein [Microbacterium resistens]|uniref:AraC-like ligand-binding domain-containing protein n=1 Tax=Microbacterium resistens TaxID=156977 RepID=UPI00082CA5EF|nr:helix-turn-helix domain-containing protein [Microbacterium resistens]